MTRRQQYLSISLIILLCVVTRLPQLLSPYLVLDTDEAIVGLMSKHLYEGKNIPVFFYGQAFGFSLVECSASAFMFLFTGVNHYGVKLGMLLLWTLGMVFFYLGMLRVNEKNRVAALLFTIAFIVNPAWAVWSMKARGGYLTSVLFFSLFLFLLFGKNKTRLSWGAIGALAAMTYFSQPLWLPGLLPLLAYKTISEKGWREKGFLFIGAIIVLVPMLVAKHNASHFYAGTQADFSVSAAYEKLLSFPQYLFNGMRGSYVLGYILPASQACDIIGFICSECVWLLLLLGIYNLFDKERRNWLFISSVLSLLLSIVMVLFLENNTRPRWLLAIPGYIIFALYLFYDIVRLKKFFRAALIALIIPGLYAMWTFKDYQCNPTTNAQLVEVVNYIEKQGVHYAFSVCSALNSQLEFYSGEQIICRAKDPGDRYMPYYFAANNALAAGKPVAIIGYDSDHNGVPDNNNIIRINQYFICLNADKKLLTNSGFLLEQ